VLVDGVAVKARRVTPDFVAVDVAPGEHVIDFRFDRPWWVWATWLPMLIAPLLGWAIGRRYRGAASGAGAGERGARGIGIGTT
jgi:hypothetical protein